MTFHMNPYQTLMERKKTKNSIIGLLELKTNKQTKNIMSLYSAKHFISFKTFLWTNPYELKGNHSYGFN